MSRCAVGLALVGGEVTTKGYVDVQKIVREVIKEIGYTEAGVGFDADSCSVLSAIHSRFSFQIRPPENHQSFRARVYVLEVLVVTG